MVTNKPKRKASGAVIPLRVPAPLQMQIQTVSTKSGLSNADIMRLALERGLSSVEKMFEAPSTKAA